MKKSGKRWYRPRNIVLAILLAGAIVLGWAGLEVWRVYHDHPVIAVDYGSKLQQLSADAQPPGENAWPLLEQASALYERAEHEIVALQIGDRRNEFSLDTGHPDFSRIIGSVRIEDEIERERAFLALLEERGVFGFLDQASGMPNCVRPMTQHQLQEMEILVHFSGLRGLAKANAARSRLAVVNRQFDVVAECFDRNLAMARHLSHQPIIISHLVAQSIRALAQHELARELVERRFDERTCVSLLRALDRDDEFAPISLAMQGEHLFALSFVQQYYSDDGTGDGYLVASASDSLQLLSSRTYAQGILGAVESRFIHASKAEVQANLEAYFDKAIASSHRSPGERAGQVPETDKILSQAKRDGDFITGALAPALDKAIESEARGTQMAQCLRTMLGIELFQARYGRLPESLDDLVPEVFDQLPIDPYRDGPFVYRRVANDAAGREYLLYSTGLDQTDDGGQEYFDPATGSPSMAALSNPHLRGFDYVIFRPRGGAPGRPIDPALSE